MKTSLLKKLSDFYEEEPNDPFNAYALALEYEKFDRSQAREWYDLLLSGFPEYLPTYYQAAQFFIAEDNNEKAEHLFKKGIELAGKLKNNKIQQELTRALKAHEDEQGDW